jgi:hypothetical protein
MRNLFTFITLAVAALAADQSVNLGTFTFSPKHEEAMATAYQAYTNSVGTNTPMPQAAWLRLESSNLLFAAWSGRARFLARQNAREMETRWQDIPLEKKTAVMDVIRSNYLSDERIAERSASK